MKFVMVNSCTVDELVGSNNTLSNFHYVNAGLTPGDATVEQEHSEPPTPKIYQQNMLKYNLVLQNCYSAAVFQT